MSIFKGWFGEIKSTFTMWLSLDKQTYHRFHNVILPSSNGTTQIDHILVSIFGIFIVETKNKSGWIFGSEDQDNWTQTLRGKKYPFQNPLRQTYRQKKVLAKFLSVDESQIQTVIYFVGDSKFKTHLPSNVMSSGLGSYIKRFVKQTVSQEEMNRIVKQIEQHTAESELSNSDHLRSLKERHSSTTICPKCGSHLKLKEARNGPKAGMKFLGCESYPQCRFTRNS